MNTLSPWKVTIIGKNGWISRKDKQLSNIIISFRIEDIMFSKIVGQSMLVRTPDEYIFVQQQIYKFKPEAEITAFDGERAISSNGWIYNLNNLTIMYDDSTVGVINPTIIHD